MPHIIKTQSTPYSAMQMFALVENCEDYPEFLPFCTRGTSEPLSDDELLGTIYVNKGPFKKSFTTHNTMHRDANPPRIEIQLVNGPFKKLDGQWRFIETENGCDVTLDLDYDMQSGLLNNALSSGFEWIANAMVESFCGQAHKRYGKQ